MGLSDDLLAKPTAPAILSGNPDRAFTKRVEVNGDKAQVEVRSPGIEPDPEATRSEALRVLEGQGLNPDEWEVSGFRSSEWTLPSGDLGTSSRYSFARRGGVALAAEVPLDEIVGIIKKHKPKAQRATGQHGYVVALGDMQFGKIDGDGVEGTVQRTVAAINQAADQLRWYRRRYDIGHVHIAWLGDHIEGFLSQGGANAWRTQLTLSEQIRLTRRVMAHAMTTFAPEAERVTMVAVPGNHGETTRFAGKGVTRYDDSHDTESLVAVSEAAALNPAFEHVEFYVPETDEMTVVLDVAGTVIGHVHGHQFRPGKHFEWLQGQAFGDRKGASLRDTDLLLAGHMHHLVVDTNGGRMFVQVPPFESESTWYRHATGTTTQPGLVVAVTHNGMTSPLEVICGE